MALRVLMVTLLLVLASCTSHPPVHFASAPPGARILIDGEDSGFVTPTSLAIGDKRRRTVEFVLPGYEVAVRDLRSRKRRDYTFYNDWQLHYNTWRFPLWLNLRDFAVQRKTYAGEQPSRLFVRMKRKSGRQ